MNNTQPLPASSKEAEAVAVLEVYMRRKFDGILISVIAAALFMSFSGAAMADETIDYSEVASSGEMAAVETVELPGMNPVTAEFVEDGEYDIKVRSSSKMFKIEKAVLTVKDGKMQAVMTMGGKGYLKIYMGTGAEAAKADVSEYIDYEEDAEGRHNFTIEVEALDKGLDCAAFSRNKEKWYDRQILFEAGSLPEKAVKVELPDYEALEKAARDARIEAMKEQKNRELTSAAEAAEVDLDDGIYTVEIALAGGSGKATVKSPAVLNVKDGKAYVNIEWSSPNYDYMKLGDKKFLPVNTEGNSVFELPVIVFNEPVSVIADTVAMSVPHEIEYTITLDSATISSDNNYIVPAAISAVIIAAALAVFIIKKRKKDKNE